VPWVWYLSACDCGVAKPTETSLHGTACVWLHNVPIWYQSIGLSVFPLWLLREPPNRPPMWCLFSMTYGRHMYQNAPLFDSKSTFPYLYGPENRMVRKGVYLLVRRWEMGLRTWFHPPIAVGGRRSARTSSGLSSASEGRSALLSRLCTAVSGYKRTGGENHTL
jgi:hypothetical protein